MEDSIVAAFRPLFPRQHIPIILYSIRQAGKNLCKQTARDREDWLTTRLYRQLIRMPSFRDGPLQIHLQPEIVASDVDTNTNTPEGRLDLQVSCGLGYEVYFAIEAKRLRVRLSGNRLFLGSREYVLDGMLRFITGQYAPFMEAGAMLGYVYDGEMEKARSDIDRHIQRKAAELKLKQTKQLVPSPIINDKSIDETHHVLGERAFAIYHLFLAV